MRSVLNVSRKKYFNLSFIRISLLFWRGIVPAFYASIRIVISGK